MGSIDPTLLWILKIAVIVIVIIVLWIWVGQPLLNTVLKH